MWPPDVTSTGPGRGAQAPCPRAACQASILLRASSRAPRTGRPLHEASPPCSTLTSQPSNTNLAGEDSREDGITSWQEVPVASGCHTQGPTSHCPSTRHTQSGSFGKEISQRNRASLRTASHCKHINQDAKSPLSLFCSIPDVGPHTPCAWGWGPLAPGVLTRSSRGAPDQGRLWMSTPGLYPHLTSCLRPGRLGALSTKQEPARAFRATPRAGRGRTRPDALCWLQEELHERFLR